jgi:hypothetical protein
MCGCHESRPRPSSVSLTVVNIRQSRIDSMRACYILVVAPSFSNFPFSYKKEPRQSFKRHSSNVQPASLTIEIMIYLKLFLHVVGVASYFWDVVVDVLMGKELFGKTVANCPADSSLSDCLFSSDGWSTDSGLPNYQRIHLVMTWTFIFLGGLSQVNSTVRRTMLKTNNNN